MRAVRVKYTVKPDYVETNKSNIRNVMTALRKHPIDGMNYSTFVLDDGVTFVHVNMCKDQQTMSKLQELDEFKKFRQELKASDPVAPPQSIDLHLVGSSFDV